MEAKNKTKFGSLTQKQKDFQSVDSSLNILFKNYKNKSRKFNIQKSDSEIAMANLRKLTVILQTKRLREKTKSYCKSFNL